MQNADLALSPSTPAALVKRGQRQETATAAEHCRSSRLENFLKQVMMVYYRSLLHSIKKKKEEKSG